MRNEAKLKDEALVVFMKWSINSEEKLKKLNCWIKEA